MNLAKKAIVITLVFFSLVGSIALATAQDSATPLITLSTTELNFYGQEGTLPSSRNLIVVGLADEVEVKLVASDLYSNRSGESVAVKLNITQNPFPVPKNTPITVNIALSSGVKAGTYKGVIIVTATANGNITTTNLAVIATIGAIDPWYFSGVQWGLILAIGVLIFVALIFPEDKEFYFKGRKILSKKIWVVGLGIIVAIIWLVSLTSFPFGDPSTVITTSLITPFLAYAIGIVKDKRTERLEKEKVSRTIRDEGIKKDIDLIRNLIGEMATHCASFNPNFYEEKLNKPFDSTDYLLYNKTGLLAKKVWDESCKQGFVADIHTLHLEKYYDFIPFYNQCYTHAMTLVNDNEKDAEKKNSKKKFLGLFEKFRKTYGELQKVLFVYLSYTLELYSKTALSPMKLEHPRITRTLLYKLIDYEILKPFEFIDKLSEFKTEEIVKELVVEELDRELGNLKNRLKQASPEKEVELRKQVNLINKLKPKLSNNKGRKKELIEKSKKHFIQKIHLKEDFKKDRPDLKDKDKQEFNKEFKKYVEEKIVEEGEFEVLEAVEAWVTMKFKEKIEWWELSADDFETIVNYIYAADEVPHFFRHMQDDFQKTYLKLKEFIRELSKEDIPALPKDSEVKEYKISIDNVYKDEDQGTLKLELDAKKKSD
ncbi:MAG: hypothetical protein JSV12_02265 [Candidatus Bathyarchaeota archaeon]|nr:MAG: hypothetical protein JSV12_02265 [Candidatus Bathyarchaeota archaeon]